MSTKNILRPKNKKNNNKEAAAVLMAVRNHEVADKIVALFSLKVWKDLWTRQIYPCYWNANVVWRRWRRKEKELYLYFYMKRRCIYQPQPLSCVCLDLNRNFFCNMCIRLDNDGMDEGHIPASSTYAEGLIGSLWSSVVCPCRTPVRSDSFSLHLLAFLCSISFF